MHCTKGDNDRTTMSYDKQSDAADGATKPYR